MPRVKFDGPYAVKLPCLPPDAREVEPGAVVDVPESVAADLVKRADWSAVKTDSKPAPQAADPKQEG